MLRGHAREKESSRVVCSAAAHAGDIAGVGGGVSGGARWGKVGGKQTRPALRVPRMPCGVESVHQNDRAHNPQQQTGLLALCPGCRVGRQEKHFQKSGSIYLS